MNWLRSIALSTLACCIQPALAIDYGSLRISVSEINLDHRTNVQLKLNGKNFAGFSHSSSPLVKSVTEEFLAKGTSTPMSSDYGGLQSGCRFRFLIEYSISGLSWIRLGTFDAPASIVSGTLPIGLCDGSLCSGNPAIRARLEEVENERWRKAGEALRKWLQDAVERDARETLKQKRRIEAEKPPSLEPGRLPDDANILREDAILADAAKDLSPEVPSPDVRWSNRIDAAVMAGSAEGLASHFDALDRFYAACAASGGAQVQLYCARYGGAAPFVAMAEAMAIAYAADPEAAMAAFRDRQQAMRGGPSLADTRDRLAQQRFQLQATIDAKRSEAMWNQVSAAARAGVALSPLNDVADFCEAMTGREFCVTSGRVLGRDERLFAILGMIAGNRQIWDSLGDAFRAQILNRSADPKGLARVLERIADNSEFSRQGAKHILVGDLETQAGLTYIKGGLHTEDSVKSLMAQMRDEGRAFELVNQRQAADLLQVHAQGEARAGDKVFRFEGSNGVSLYLFPRSSFLSSETWERNIAVFTHAGNQVAVHGAKTVFPAKWDYGKLADALVSVRDNPSRVAGPGRFGSFEDVEIRVGVDESGKISAAYPTIKVDR